MQKPAYQVSNGIYTNIIDLAEHGNLDECDVYVFLKGKIITINSDKFILETDLNSLLGWNKHPNPQAVKDIYENLALQLSVSKATLFYCEFCDFVTNAKGQYIKHIHDNHNRHFIEIIREDLEVKSLKDLLPKEFRDPENNVEFETDEIDHIRAKYVTDDMDNYDIIEIEREFNSYGVVFYTVKIVMYCSDMEIEDSDVYVNRFEEELTEAQAQRMDAKADKQEAKWLKLPTWDSKNSAIDFCNISPSIESEYNPVNFGYYLRYRAVNIDFKTQDTDDIKATIHDRDIFSALYLSVNSKKY